MINHVVNFCSSNINMSQDHHKQTINNETIL